MKLAVSLKASGSGLLGIIGFCLIHGSFVGPACAQSTAAFHPDSSYTAESLLRNAARHVADKQWPEAIDLYLRVIEQHGDSVALAPAADEAGRTSLLYVNARLFCQKALASLPPEGLAQYRQRVDARAAALFRDAAERSDRAALRRVVCEFFASRSGDQAAELLGDLEFRAGRFREALAAYYTLLPNLNAQAGLVYPDSEIDPAQVAAKILLSRAARGDVPTEAELQGFRRANPDIKTSFAGREGALAELVTQAIDDDRWNGPPPPARGWPTFARSADRNSVIAEPIDVGSFQWKVYLPLPEAARPGPDPEEIGRFGGGFRPPATLDSEPAVFPIVVGDDVIICDETRVRSFHMNVRPETASDEEFNESVIHWRSEYNPPFSPSATSRSAFGQAVPRYTLTASGDRIFARLGATGRGTSGGTLYAIRSNPDVEGKLIWRKFASDITLPIERAGEHHVASFEGSPVADLDRVYIALTEAATESWAYVACFDAETGETLWVRHLGTSSPRVDPARNMPLGPSIGNRMLTLQDGTLYYQMNMGAVASLDAESGAVRWVATYPVAERGLLTFPKRAPNPAIVAEGLVIIAPEDSPSLFAFEAETGKLAWKSDPVPELQHALGVSNGKLFATGNHLYTFEARTGRVLRVWPEAGGRFDGFGRGVLAGDSVYWPTRTEILVLDQATGGDVRASIPLFQSFGYGGGNLAVGDGYLAVAQRERLTIYCQTRRLIERFRERVAAAPEAAADHFQLARLAEASGEHDLALASLNEVLKRAKPGDRFEGAPLVELARDRQHLLLINLGDALGEKGRWDQAAARFEQAAGLDGPSLRRLAALFKLAAAREAEGRATAAVTTLQNILSDERLSSLAIAASENRLARVDILVAERLQEIVGRHGRAVYADYDRQAANLLERARRDQNLQALRELTRRFPAAECVAAAHQRRAEIAHGHGKPAEALDACDRWLAAAPNDSARGAAMFRIALIHEGEGRLAEARAAYREVLARFATQSIELDGRIETAGALARRKLNAAELRGAGTEEAAPLSTGVLGRLAERAWATASRPFVLDDGAEPALLLLGNQSAVTLVNMGQAAPVWSVEIGAEAEWAADHGDTILVGSAGQVTALARAGGGVLWRFKPGNGPTADPAPSPFTRIDPVPVGLAAKEPGGFGPQGRLHGFQLTPGRLRMQQGDGTLLSIDVADGRLLWAFKAPPSGEQAGRLNPLWFACGKYVLIEQLPTKTLLALAAESGAPLGELPRADAASPMPRVPIALDSDHVALALDERTLGRFDLAHVALDWVHRDEAALPRAAPIRAWFEEGALLALQGGRTLVRLDPKSGQQVWERSLGLAKSGAVGGPVAVSEELVYALDGHEVRAFRLNDGAPAWSRPVASERGAHWSIGLSGPYLVVFPRVSETDPDGLSTITFDYWNRESGAPMHRFPFGAPARRLEVVLGDQSVLVASEARGWLLGRKP